MGPVAVATLGARMSWRDSATFVGRGDEMSVVEELLVDDPPASVVLVHGPGGIGKSALLREVARRGRRVGWTPVVVEGRDLPPLPGALDEALAPARTADRPLVLIDTYERMAALGPHLRRVLPTLPDRAVVLVAGRSAPEEGWFEGGWEWVVRELPLGPLPRADALALLAAHGLADGARAAELALWAGGSPLALTLGARAAQDPAWRPGDGIGASALVGDPGEMVRAVVRRLTEREGEGVHRDVLWVASLARTVTAPLLADVLPDVDADEAMRWLAGRSFTEPLGEGTTLHDLVRWAVRRDLAAREPERERDLLRRLADSLHARALDGRILLSVDLAELVRAPELRALYSWEGAANHRIDALRPGDARQIAARLTARGRSGWWDLTRDLVERAPDVVAVARDRRGTVCGFSISVTAGAAPPAAHDDPVLGPWLRHAAALTPAGDAILCRDASDFTADPASRVEAMLHVSVVVRSDLANPRYLYLPIEHARDDVVAFATRLGARHVPELDTAPAAGHDGQQCHLLDCGPGGVLGLQRDLVYAELGLRPPVRPDRAGPQPDRTTGPGGPDVAPLELRVLAPVVEVLVDGTPTPVSEAQAKLLLALAVSHPAPLHAEQASDLLWPDEPLEATRHRLHNLVLRVRKALGDRDAVTARRGGALHLAAERWDVDLWRFRRALASPDGSDGGTGDPGDARRRALRSPRGNLADAQFPYDERLVDERHGLGAEWLRHARAAVASGDLAPTDLGPAAAALGLSPDDL